MLVAIDDENEYFNPSLMPQDQRNLVIPLIRDKVDRNLMFCPHCLAASNSRHPVSFVNPKEKIVHFRHKSGDRTQECASYRGESDQHLTTKLALLGHFSTQGNIIEVESRRYGEKTSQRVYRTPDVTVTLINGEIHAHEVQVSPINISSLQERTEALLSLGLTHVHWYLSYKNIRDENVNYLIDKIGATPYQLFFDEQGIPSWSVMLQKIVKMPPKSETGIKGCASASTITRHNESKFSRFCRRYKIAENDKLYQHASRPGQIAVLNEQPWMLDGILSVTWIASTRSDEKESFPTDPKYYPKQLLTEISSEHFN